MTYRTGNCWGVTIVREGDGPEDGAGRLFVSNVTVSKRERMERSITTDDLIDHLHVLGYDLALVPSRRPGARPTGTGWPA